MIIIRMIMIIIRMPPYNNNNNNDNNNNNASFLNPPFRTPARPRPSPRAPGRSPASRAPMI